MSYPLPFSTNYHCHLNQDQLERFEKLDSNLECTAQWADGSKRICGKPLGAHIRIQSGSIPLFYILTHYFIISLFDYFEMINHIFENYLFNLFVK